MLFLLPVIGWAAAGFVGSAAIAGIAEGIKGSPGGGSAPLSEDEILVREREKKRKIFRENLTLELHQQLKTFVKSHPNLITLNQELNKPTFTKLKKFSSSFGGKGGLFVGVISSLYGCQGSLSMQDFTMDTFGFGGPDDPFHILQSLMPQLELSSSWRHTTKEIEDIEEELDQLKQIRAHLEKNGRVSL